MASPQIEDGHIDIANELAEALMVTQLSGYQSRVLWAVWRKTYGWHKKEDWISNSQLVEMTGLKSSHVSRTVKELKDRNIITKNGNKMAFNKDYAAWRELPKLVTVTKNGSIDTKIGNTVTKNGSGVTKNGEHKRNYTKETITKDIYTFWNDCKIIIHKKLRPKVKSKIQSTMKEYDLEDIFDGICNYAKVYNSRDHYFSHKWTLDNFLARGLNNFIPEADPVNNYLRDEIKKANERAGSHTPKNICRDCNREVKDMLIDGRCRPCDDKYMGRASPQSQGDVRELVQQTFKGMN